MLNNSFSFQISDAFNISLGSNSSNSTTYDKELIDFKSLQYALFITCFVEIIGGLFFLITAFYIIQDKRKVDQAVQGKITFLKYFIRLILSFILCQSLRANLTLSQLGARIAVIVLYNAFILYCFPVTNQLEQCHTSAKPKK